MVNSGMNSDRSHATDANNDPTANHYHESDDDSEQGTKANSDKGSVGSILPPLPFPNPPQVLKTSVRCRTPTLWPSKLKYNSSALGTFDAAASTRRASTAPVLGRTNFVSTCRPGEVPDVPPTMTFHGWYQEGHGLRWNDRKQFRIEFDTASKECAISIDGSLMVTTAKTAKKTPIDIWDLHVGAVIIVLGKRLELKKAHLATQMWLDSQASKMLKEKKDIEAELRKFGWLSYNKDYDNRTNPQHRPCHLNKTKAFHPYQVGNGRVNLRRLGVELDELSLHLRKYRKRVPGSEAEILPPDFMGTVWAEDMVPAVWNAELMRGSAGPALEPSSALSAKTDEKGGGYQNYYEWLKAIPLARTAAGIDTLSPEPADMDKDDTRFAYASTAQMIRANDEKHRLTAPKHDGNPFNRLTAPKHDDNPFNSMMKSFKHGNSFKLK